MNSLSTVAGGTDSDHGAMKTELTESVAVVTVHETAINAVQRSAWYDSLHARVANYIRIVSCWQSTATINAPISGDTVIYADVTQISQISWQPGGWLASCRYAGAWVSHANTPSSKPYI